MPTWCSQVQSCAINAFVLKSPLITGDALRKCIPVLSCYCLTTINFIDTIISGHISRFLCARMGRCQGGCHGVSRAAWPRSMILSQLVRVTDLPGRHRLRSSSTQLLHLPPFRRSPPHVTVIFLFPLYTLSWTP